MFKKKREIEEEVLKELIAIRQARKKLECMVRDVEDLKGKMRTFDYGIGKVAKILANHDPLIQAHNEGLLDLSDRVEKLEKPMILSNYLYINYFNVGEL